MSSEHCLPRPAELIYRRQVDAGRDSKKYATAAGAETKNPESLQIQGF
jgi:hypothetical protein